MKTVGKCCSTRSIPRQMERGYKYWRIAVEGGTDPQEIRLNMDRPVYFEHMSFHPDGKRIAFTADSNKSAVWALENFLPTTNKRTSLSRC